MKILITTPTGRIGRKIVPELLASEFSVRLLVRDPARLPEEIRPHVDIVRGSADHAATLREALNGIEALFYCVPTESLQEANVEGHYERFACAASQAIRDTRTPRVVTISAGGRGRARKAGRISGLHVMEEILDESGAAIRHLRCAWFMENFLERASSIYQRGQISYPIAGHIPIPMVAVTDIADAALKWLARRDWKGIQSIPVHGAEDLSFAQAAAVIERTLQRPVKYQEVSRRYHIQTLTGLGASVEYAQALAEMFSQYAQGIARTEARTFEFSTSTTFAAWVESTFLAAVQSFRSRSDPGTNRSGGTMIPHSAGMGMNARPKEHNKLQLS